MTSTKIRAIVVAALYDFAASLTVRKDPITAGSSHNASPMAEAVSAFIKMRECDTITDPPVREWRERLALAEAEDDVRDFYHAPMSFREDLERTINRWSKDNEYGTPDFVLAKYIEEMLDAFGRANAATEKAVGGSIADRACKDIGVVEYGTPIPVVRVPPILDVDLSDQKCKSEWGRPVTVTVQGVKAIAEQMQKAAAEGVRISWNRDPRKR
jgi:hypothetical protein